MAFADVVGNERIKDILRHSLRRGRLPNSLLFCGPRGVGKREMAFVLAQALCCQRSKDDACGECPPCRMIENGRREGKNRYPDVMLILPNPKKSDTIEVDTVREIKELAYLKPIMGGRRVFIIDGVEKDYLRDEGANALLKVIEEPPPFTHFILIADNPELVLPTIKSRCRVLVFSLIPPPEVEKALRAKGVEPGPARILSVLSEGNLERALHTDWEEFTARREAAWEMFRALLRREKASAFLENYAYLRRKEAEKELPVVLEVFATLGRDLLLLKEGGDPARLLNPDLAEALAEESRSYSLDETLHFLRRVQAVLDGLDRKRNVGLLVSEFYSSIINRL